MTPQAKRYQWIWFTGAVSGDLGQIRARLLKAQEESPGWRFRIETREVVQHEGPWREVPACGER